MGNREVRLDQPSLVIQPPLAWSLVTPDGGPAPAGSGEVDASGFYRAPGGRGDPEPALGRFVPMEGSR